MSILDSEKERLRNEALESTRRGAHAYAEKLETALELLLDFDAKRVDDIEDFKRSLEVTGTAGCLMTTKDGYQCLMDVSGELLASNILEAKP